MREWSKYFLEKFHGFTKDRFEVDIKWKLEKFQLYFL